MANPSKPNQNQKPATATPVTPVTATPATPATFVLKTDEEVSAMPVDARLDYFRARTKHFHELERQAMEEAIAETRKQMEMTVVPFVDRVVAFFDAELAKVPQNARTCFVETVVMALNVPTAPQNATLNATSAKRGPKVDEVAKAERLEKVIAMVKGGKTSAEIASAIGMSVPTVSLLRAEARSKGRL